MNEDNEDTHSHHITIAPEDIEILPDVRQWMIDRGLYLTNIIRNEANELVLRVVHWRPSFKRGETSKQG
jgi:hypothetical protein